MVTVAEVDDYLSVIIAEESWGFCAAIDIVIAVVHLSLHLLRKEIFSLIKNEADLVFN